MTNRASVRMWNNSLQPLHIILEPYATEFTLPAGSTCEVVGHCERAVPEISIEYTGTGLVFWGETTDAVYEYWQDETLID